MHAVQTATYYNGGSRTSTMSSAMSGATGTTATPQASNGSALKRKRQLVTYTETTEFDQDTGKLRDIIVIEDTPPPNNTNGTPSTTSTNASSSNGYAPTIRTRAQAAAAAAATANSNGSAHSGQQPALKKRKRDPLDDPGPSAVIKKPAVGNGLTKHWQTSATEDSSSSVAHASTKGVLANCDDKEGHYIITEGDMIDKRYRTVKMLGQGTFGKVVEAFDTKTNNAVAIKIIRAVPKYRDASKIEIRVVQKLKERDPENKHKCVHLLNWFDHRNHICLVFELLGMCVYDFLKDNEFAPFPRNQIQSFAKQLLDSPENILLVRNDFRVVPIPGALRNQPKSKRILNSTDIRLIDFGSATFQEEYHSTVVSTRHYRAPEIILGLGWSYPCDAFSLGCIFVEFFTGMALFQTHDNLEHLAMMEQVMGKMPDRFAKSGHRSKAEFFKETTIGVRVAWPPVKATKQSKKEVKATRSLDQVVPPLDLINRHFLDMVRKLLMFDPQQRLTVREALTHGYLQTPINGDS
ncbi:kinase-like domain-containing protein [Auriculariales sp. MPI-PUGE-AT-0066]|nr:kinase-like domain-containing protein [Auriculariales sp. MPI-PUGE-AT-0066]